MAVSPFSGPSVGTGLSTVEQDRSWRLRQTTPVLAGVPLGIALLTFVAWACGGGALQARWPAVFVMKANTAGVGLAAAALTGLWLCGRFARGLAVTCATAGLLLACTSLAEYGVGDLGIDQAVFHDEAAVLHPGRTSPGTASCLAMMAVATLLLPLAVR